MTHIVALVIVYLQDHWQALSALVGGGAGLSVFLEWVLHKFNIDSKKLAYTLLHLLSVAGALSAYFVDNANVPAAYAGLAIAAQTVHRFIVSPVYANKILPYLTFLSENQNQTATVNRPQASQPATPPRPAPAEPQAPSFVS